MSALSLRLFQNMASALNHFIRPSPTHPITVRKIPHPPPRSPSPRLISNPSHFREWSYEISFSILNHEITTTEQFIHHITDYFEDATTINLKLKTNLDILPAIQSLNTYDPITIFILSDNNNTNHNSINLKSIPNELKVSLNSPSLCSLEFNHLKEHLHRTLNEHSKNFLSPNLGILQEITRTFSLFMLPSRFTVSRDISHTRLTWTHLHSSYSTSSNHENSYSYEIFYCRIDDGPSIMITESTFYTFITSPTTLSKLDTDIPCFFTDLDDNLCPLDTQDRKIALTETFRPFLHF